MDEVFFTLDPFGFSVRYRLAEQIDSRMLLRKNKGSGDDGLNGNACRSRKKVGRGAGADLDNHEFILGTRLFLQTDEERQSSSMQLWQKKLRIPATFFYLPTISIKKEKPLIREWLFRCLF